MNPIFARPHNRKRNRFKAMLKANWADFKTKLARGVKELIIGVLAILIMVLVVASFVFMPWWGTLLALLPIGGIAMVMEALE